MDHKSTGPDAKARREPRKRTAMSGRIVHMDGITVQDCTIIDISPSGACVRVSRDVPGVFHLINIQGRTAHAAEVAWRKGGSIGLRFTASYTLGSQLPERLGHLRKLWMDYATR
jgi:hypothetical protein